jgi:hypothetical protein
MSRTNQTDTIAGFFSIAFMVAFAFGKDPARFYFDASLTRRHLVMCLLKNQMTMFPVLKARVPGPSTTELVQVTRAVRSVRKPARYVDEVL